MADDDTAITLSETFSVTFAELCVISATQVIADSSVSWNQQEDFVFAFTGTDCHADFIYSVSPTLSAVEITMDGANNILRVTNSDSSLTQEYDLTI